MNWRIVLEQDSETLDWDVWCPELPACVSAGETADEARENIKEAIELFLQKDARGKRGDMKGKIWIADDFCAPIHDMKEYMW